MTPEQIYPVIESSTLDGVSLDILYRRARLELHITIGGVEYRHTLAFEGVSGFQVDRPSAAPWGHVELSDVVLEPSAARPGQWRFRAELWSTASLEVHAERVLFDGGAVRQAAV